MASLNKVLLIGNLGKDPEILTRLPEPQSQVFLWRHRNASRTKEETGKSGPSGTTSPSGDAWRKSPANTWQREGRCT